MDSYTEMMQAVLEEPDLVPRPRRVERVIVHKTEVGRLVKENYPNASSLVYAQSNNLLQAMLSKDYTFNTFETKLVGLLRTCREKGKPNVYVLGALSRMIKEL